MKKKKIKKSIALPLALFIYATAMAVYFIPRNNEMSDTEKWVTVIASYVIIGLLWFTLKKKEDFTRKRDEEWTNKQNENKK
ncbi:MAG: hypothetical protein IJ467_03500 [Bacteroidaceae bacterium]|nr:hypothetical protein [Bacteroidaceae bacterium]